jgi:hypothetical protein
MTGSKSILPAIGVVGLLATTVAAEDSDKWTPIFNGKDLTGWAHVGPGGFVVEKGILKTEGGMGLLWYTAEPLGNAAIRVVYKNPGGVNSGVFIRIPEKPTEEWMPVNRGYEVQIDDKEDDFHRTGVLYSLTRAMAVPRSEEWNTMEITLAGDRTTVTVNGKLVTDYREGQPVPPKKETWEPDRGLRPATGYIGLQNHSKDDVVYFKEVSLRRLER